MAFGLPYPRVSQRRTFQLEPPELIALVKSALEALGWPYQILCGKDFQARVPTSNWSWHHDFKITLLPNGVVEAESKSAYQEMFCDFGRNGRNVKAFFARVEEMARPRVPPVI